MGNPRDRQKQSVFLVLYKLYQTYRSRILGAWMTMEMTKWKNRQLG